MYGSSPCVTTLVLIFQALCLVFQADEWGLLEPGILVTLLFTTDSAERLLDVTGEQGLGNSETSNEDMRRLTAKEGVPVMVN